MFAKKQKGMTFAVHLVRFQRVILVIQTFLDMAEISIIWDYSLAVHYLNSRRSNKSNKTQSRNRSLSFKLESPKYIMHNLYFMLFKDDDSFEMLVTQSLCW